MKMSAYREWLGDEEDKVYEDVCLPRMVGR